MVCVSVRVCVCVHVWSNRIRGSKLCLGIHDLITSILVTTAWLSLVCCAHLFSIQQENTRHKFSMVAMWATCYYHEAGGPGRIVGPFFCQPLSWRGLRSSVKSCPGPFAWCPLNMPAWKSKNHPLGVWIAFIPYSTNSRYKCDYVYCSVVRKVKFSHDFLFPPRDKIRFVNQKLQMAISDSGPQKRLSEIINDSFK